MTEKKTVADSFALPLTDCVSAVAYLREKAPEDAKRLEYAVRKAANAAKNGNEPKELSVRGFSGNPFALAAARLLGLSREKRVKNFDRVPSYVRAGLLCRSRGNPASEFRKRFEALCDALPDHCGPLLHSGVTASFLGEKGKEPDLLLSGSGFASRRFPGSGRSVTLVRGNGGSFHEKKLFLGEDVRVSVAATLSDGRGSVETLGLRHCRTVSGEDGSGSTRETLHVELTPEDMLRIAAVSASGGFVWVGTALGGGWIFRPPLSGAGTEAFATDLPGYGAERLERRGADSEDEPDGPEGPFFEADPLVSLPESVFPLLVRHFRRLAFRDDKTFLALWAKTFCSGVLTFH